MFRVGGEEFVVLMPNTTVNGEDIVAEKIREAISTYNYPIVGKITVSIGVAQRMKSESLNDWYIRVDKALYCAKEGGRNRVVNFINSKNMPVALVHLEWKSQWESGNKEIDEQHRELIEIANSLVYMSLSDTEVQKTINQLEILIKHIVNHFEYEETVLAGIGYPQYLEHSNIHKSLIDKSLNLKASYINGELKATALFSFMVDDVVLGHMVDEDKKFFPYIMSKQ